jgi:hypothetical protein
MILVLKEEIGKRSAKPLTQGIQHAGFQGNLEFQSPPAKLVTGDSESFTNSRTLHTLNDTVVIKIWVNLFISITKKLIFMYETWHFIKNNVKKKQNNLNQRIFCIVLQLILIWQ